MCSPTRLTAATSLIVGLFLPLAFAASSITVTGRAVDSDGQPLAAVPICLHPKDQPRACQSVVRTDEDGRYAFTPLRARGRYAVSVAPSEADPSDDVSYDAFVWSPSAVDVRFVRMADGLQRVDFVGTFGFANFQRDLHLTAADLPGIDEFDPADEIVFVKVFYVDLSGQQNLVFLGRLTNVDTLSITASTPVAVTVLHYEIYSATHSVAGTISLTKRQVGP